MFLLTQGKDMVSYPRIGLTQTQTNEGGRYELIRKWSSELVINHFQLIELWKLRQGGRDCTCRNIWAPREGNEYKREIPEIELWLTTKFVSWGKLSKQSGKVPVDHNRCQNNKKPLDGHSKKEQTRQLSLKEIEIDQGGWAFTKRIRDSSFKKWPRNCEILIWGGTKQIIRNSPSQILFGEPKVAKIWYLTYNRMWEKRRKRFYSSKQRNKPKFGGMDPVNPLFSSVRDVNDSEPT